MLLPPKFALLEKLNIDKFKLENEMTKTKMRYELKGYDPNEDSQPTIEDFKIDKAMNDIESESRIPFHPVNGSVSMARVRATEMPGNARITLPKAVHPSLEAEMQIRTEAYSKAFTNYQNHHCNGTGQQRRNTSDKQRRGLESVQKRTKSKEIMVTMTSKSGKFSMISR